MKHLNSTGEAKINKLFVGHWPQNACDQKQLPICRGSRSTPTAETAELRPTEHISVLLYF